MKLNVKKYSQRNDMWSGMEMGSSGKKMRDYGCLVTCCSMILTYYGKELNPRHLNEVLERIQAYSGAYLKWQPFADNFDLEFGGIENYDDVPAPVDEIKARIDDGHPTIIRVDFVPETLPIDQHFVVVVGYTEKDLIINDPWTGEEYFLTAKYPHTNNRWNQPKYVIYGIRELTPKFDWQPETEDSITQCLHQVENLTNKLSDANRRIEAKQNEIANLKVRLQTSESVRDTLGKEVKKYLAELGELEKDIEDYQSTIESAEKKITKLEQTNEELNDEKNKYKKWYEAALKRDYQKQDIFILIKEIIKRFGIKKGQS